MAGIRVHDQDLDLHELMTAELQLPPQAMLSTKDLPWLVGGSASQRSRFAFWLQTLERAKPLRTILVNSFPAEAGDSDVPLPPRAEDTDPQVLEIGPLNTATSTTRRPDHSGCIEWLDMQPRRSAIYVSFGTWVGPVRLEVINELAQGLEATRRPFLWVLREEQEWRAGLPDDFIDRVAGRGTVVGWAPQDRVLGHRSVGCFLTHCGWNSTMEAIQGEKRLLCYPISGDQSVNCAYIVDVWRIGIRLGSTNRSDLRDCVERIMAGKEGEEMQERVAGLRKQVTEGRAHCAAMSNLMSFVDSINTSHGKIVA